MRYLVTGAAGFIGSHITDRLLARGHAVVGFDNLSTGQEAFLDEARRSPDFTFIRGDVLNRADLRRALRGVDAVYHMAANADVRGGFAAPRVDLEQNTIGTFELLEAMREAGVTRITFASSAAALGDPAVVPTPEDCPVPEQTSFYGASKMAGEGLLSAYCEGYGFEGYVFRFVSLLGPRYPHGHVFDFVHQLLADPSRLRVLGDGSQRKSYLHVDDCVGALMHICEDLRTARSRTRPYEVYHLGIATTCAVRESAAWICDAMGVHPRIEFGTGQRGWIGDSPLVLLDTRKALATGWVPRYTLEPSIRETVGWLLENRWIFGRRAAG